MVTILANRHCYYRNRPEIRISSIEPKNYAPIIRSPRHRGTDLKIEFDLPHIKI